MSTPTFGLAPSVGPPRRNAGAWLALGIIIVGLVAAAIAGFLLFGPSGVVPTTTPPRGTLRTSVELPAPSPQLARASRSRCACEAASGQRAAPIARDPAAGVARRMLHG